MASDPVADLPKKSMSSRPLCLIVVAITGMSLALFGEKGALRLHQVKQQQASLNRQFQQLKDSNQQLRSEIDSLRNDERYIEQVARSRLSLVREGEMVFQFLPRQR